MVDGITIHVILNYMLKEGVENKMQKIDYKSKHGIMVGYIDNSQNIVAVETGWKTTPKALTEVLMGQYNSKEMAQELVDSPTLMPTFKKEDVHEYTKGKAINIGEEI